LFRLESAGDAPWRAHTVNGQQGKSMNVITYTVAQANLDFTIDQVCEDHEAVTITRDGQQAVVLVSLHDFEALEKTASCNRCDAGP
jgi:antitoxin YefM